MSNPVYTIPLLPLRDVVIFPHMVAPLFVGREKSIRALEEAMKSDKKILLSAQKDAKTNDPGPEDIYSIGTVGTIVQMLRLPDGTVKVLVEGKNRASLKNFNDENKFFSVEVEDLDEIVETDSETNAIMRTLIESFEDYIKLNKRVPSETLATITAIDDPSKLSDTVASHLSFKLSDKQEILENLDSSKRLEAIYEKIQSELEILQVEKKIRNRVKKQMEKAQKEYYLTEQMKAIQKELGDKDDFKSEILEFEEQLKKKDIPEDIKTRIEKEIKKLKGMSSMSAEATVVRNYIDWLVNLPWNSDLTEDEISIDNAQKVLDNDHFGLEKPKERITEYLAVRALTSKQKGPILCLVGPPGVGKTSLAKSVANAMGRKFVRISLGGVRDEAEIRGHRRTYIGALPGRVIQSMKKAGTNNPVFMLDEIDKLGSDFRGDPSSAMLEVLDPEQNDAFSDHYLEVDFDLSKVMFITTANYQDAIPPALRDRMEILDFTGYIEDEKIKIAQQHLLPKQIEENGLNKKEVSLDKAAISQLIRSYTRESGVRNLEREIANVLRKVARDLVEKTAKKIRVTSAKVIEYLGAPRFYSELAERTTKPGVVTGLAWTAAGGDILFVESSKMKGKGGLTLTGQLGDVMKESATAALTYVRSHTDILGIPDDFHEKTDIHVHVPAGAIPKDGPSAGVSMFTSIVSLMTGKPVKDKVAMTGEITLRGNVLPIGGVKEKVTAAHRSGIKHIILPDHNKKDLEDIPEHIKKDLNFYFAKEIMDVIDVAIPGLTGRKKRTPRKTTSKVKKVS